MSTVHSLRLKDIVIDIECFQYPIKLIKWFELNKLKYNERTLEPSVLDDMILAGIDRIPNLWYLPNDFHDFIPEFDFTDYNNIKLNMVISHENNSDDELQIFVMWLQEVGIKSGSIYYKDDSYMDIPRKVKYNEPMLATMRWSGDVCYDFQYYDITELDSEELSMLENNSDIELWGDMD